MGRTVDVIHGADGLQTLYQTTEIRRKRLQSVELRGASPPGPLPPAGTPLPDPGIADRPPGSDGAQRRTSGPGWVSLAVLLSLAALQACSKGGASSADELVNGLNEWAEGFISEFDNAALDKPEICEKVLGTTIGVNLQLGLNDMQIPFGDFRDETNRHLESTRKQAQKTGFSFSFAAANSCKPETHPLFRLNKDTLRKSLVDLKQRTEALRELFIQGKVLKSRFDPQIARRS